MVKLPRGLSEAGLSVLVCRVSKAVMPQVDIDRANRRQRIRDINQMNATFSQVLGSPRAFIPRRQVCRRAQSAMPAGRCLGRSSSTTSSQSQPVRGSIAGDSAEPPSPPRTATVRFHGSRLRPQDVFSREAAVHIMPPLCPISTNLSKYVSKVLCQSMPCSSFPWF